MAGSYNHVVDDQGRLLDGEGINSMLECMSGDVVECVEEMYGMIWWLAAAKASEINSRSFPGDTKVTAAEIVEDARQNYLEGLALSPGVVPEL